MDSLGIIFIIMGIVGSLIALFVQRGIDSGSWPVPSAHGPIPRHRLMLPMMVGCFALFCAGLVLVFI